ncbi:permease [Candidatus Sumerlaeota bacterium]|nr:permease [Candidatus Sumerlaeota bacterium]
MRPSKDEIANSGRSFFSGRSLANWPIAHQWAQTLQRRWQEFWTGEWKVLAVIAAVFLACFYAPVDNARFNNAALESLKLVRWYAREHVLLCLLPAFFIAGAIGVFVSQGAVMKHLGAGANKVVAYGVASVSGSLLAVCSCTVLPLFAGIYRMGAGIGPASAFLYAGPAVNVLAIILTARVLGFEMGVARAVCAIGFSVVIGLAMQWIFRNEDIERIKAQTASDATDAPRSLGQNAAFFMTMVGVLVFANWARPEDASGVWHAVWSAKWILTALFGAALGFCLIRWFGARLWQIGLIAAATALVAILLPHRPGAAFFTALVGLSLLTSLSDGELSDWFQQSWGFAKQILPLLFWGVLAAGLLFGAPGGEGWIPREWVGRMVGGNSLSANLFASVAGALMYFATLTEVPVLEGLLSAGMGKGPALALLLAGPALSLPNMLVIRGVMGTKKTIVYVTLVAAMSTISGMIYGFFFG